MKLMWAGMRVRIATYLWRRAERRAQRAQRLFRDGPEKGMSVAYERVLATSHVVEGAIQRLAAAMSACANLEAAPLEE